VFEINIFSICIAVFWSSLFIFIFSLLGRYTKFICYFGGFVLSLFVFLSIARIFIPIDITGYTYVIAFDAHSSLIGKTLFQIGELAVNFGVILNFIWIAGAISFLVMFTLKYRRVFVYYRGIQPENSMYIDAVLEEVRNLFLLKRVPVIVQSPSVDEPFVLGCLNPVIYLPAYLIDKQDIKNVLEHEITHILHKDTWKNVSAYIICGLFWWNPFLHVARKNLSNAIEMQCDMSLRDRKTPEEMVGYWKTVATVLIEKRSSAKKSAMTSYVYLFQKNNLSLSLRRLHVAKEYHPTAKGKHLANALVIVFALITFFFSYSLIIQPVAYPMIDSDHMEFGPTSSYIVVESDGSYSLYIDGEYNRTLPEEYANILSQTIPIIGDEQA